MAGENLSAVSMYQACLMHSRAERVLKTIVNKHLKRYEITRMEWILVATLEANNSAGGYTMSELSKVLDIKLSQLTILTTRAVDNGFAKQVSSTKDKRTKLVTVSSKGTKLIADIENSMRSAMREWLKDIPRDRLKTYIETLDMLGRVG